MEKLQTLGWILIGLVVFIWRMVQKAKATTERERRERKFSRPDASGRPRPVAPLPVTSFEEMLRQMQTQNQSEQPAPVATETTMGGRPVPSPRSQERTDIAAPSLEKPVLTRSLEGPTPEARRATPLAPAGKTPLPSYRLQEQTRATEAAARSIADRLRNPADLRAAFVLGEILQRKF